MNFVNRDRLAQPRALRAPPHPLLIAPGECALRRGDGRGCGAMFEQRTERVGLQLELVRLAAEDLVLVELARPQLRDEQFPDSGVRAHAHRMMPTVPMIERADDAHAF